MNDPQINVDHFYHQPTYHVVALLTEHAEIPVISSELKFLAGRAPTARGASWTVRRAGQQGARWLSTT